MNDAPTRPRRALIAAFLLVQFGVPMYAFVIELATGENSWPWGWQMFAT